MTADPRHAVGADGPVAMVAVGATTLAVKRWGSGRPVVCLHAVGHGSGDYSAFAARVGDAFEVVAVDWPGQGRSPDDGGAVDAARYAGLVLCNAGGLAPLDPAARFVIAWMAAFFAAGARGAAWFPAAFALYYRLAVLTAAPAAARRARIVAAGAAVRRCWPRRGRASAGPMPTSAASSPT